MHERKSEEIELEEEKLEAEIPKQPEGFVSYPISHRLKIDVPMRFLDPATHDILVLPVTLDNGSTYEAVNAIEYLLEVNVSLSNNNLQLNTKNMVFNKELYDEIKDFFELYLISNNHLAKDEYKVLANYAAGIRQEDRVFVKIINWCEDNNLEIQDIATLPERYTEEEEKNIDFDSVIKLPDELAEPELTSEDLNPCTYKKFISLSRKLYPVPFIGFVSSIYSIVVAPSPAWSYTCSSTLGLVLGVASSVVQCDCSGAFFVAPISAVTAAGITSLKYVLNTENTLIISATVSIGGPLLAYGVERLFGHLTAGNRFSLWRAVPPTPDSLGAVPSPSANGMVPRPL